MAVSFAHDTKDLVQSSVAGFVCITDVDANTQKISILSPQALPECIFVLSEITFKDKRNEFSKYRDRLCRD